MAYFSIEKCLYRSTKLHSRLVESVRLDWAKGLPSCKKSRNNSHPVGNDATLLKYTIKRDSPRHAQAYSDVPALIRNLLNAATMNMEDSETSPITPISNATKAP